jgi:hypothetical protein
LEPPPKADAPLAQKPPRHYFNNQYQRTMEKLNAEQIAKLKEILKEMDTASVEMNDYVENGYASDLKTALLTIERLCREDTVLPKDIQQELEKLTTGIYQKRGGWFQAEVYICSLLKLGHRLVGDNLPKPDVKKINDTDAQTP